MRALILSTKIVAKIREQVVWCERRENWYCPGRIAPDLEPPGDNPAYVLMLDDGFRVVYTHTLMLDGHHYKHLSVSVEGTKLPSTVAVFTIATLFGFTGGVIEQEVTTRPGKDWLIDLPKDQRCVVLAQAIKETTHAT